MEIDTFILIICTEDEDWYYLISSVLNGRIPIFLTYVCVCMFVCMYVCEYRCQRSVVCCSWSPLDRNSLLLFLVFLETIKKSSDGLSKVWFYVTLPWCVSDHQSDSPLFSNLKLFRSHRLQTYRYMVLLP